MDDGLKTKAIYWLAGKLPPCEDITRLASESRERPLTLREHVQARLHFLICVWCSRYWSQLATIHSVSKEHSDEVLSDEADGPRLSDDAKERLKRALRDGH